MKKIAVFIILIFIVSNISAKLNDTLRVHPELNGWDTKKMNFDDNLAEDFWFITIRSTSTDTEASEYLFMNWNWSNRWVDGSGDANEVVNLNWYDYDPGTNNLINDGVTENYYYTFRFKDVGYANTQGAVLETSAEPVSINSVTQIPVADSVTDENSVTITVEIDTTKCAEENIYVRYSNDNWASDSLLLVSFTGTNGTAEILTQSEGTTVNYYVFSTTVTNPGTNYDLLTLSYDNNNGNNYTYTVGGKPKVLSASQYNKFKVDVTFSEAMDTTSATDPLNYSITSTKKEVTVNDVSILSDAEYRLDTSGLNNDIDYTVTVDTSVTDMDGNSLDPDNNSANFTSYIYAPITFIIVDTANARLTDCFLKGSWIKTTGFYDVAWDGGATEQMYDDGTHGDLVMNDHRWSRLDYLVVDSSVVWEWGAVDQNQQWLIDGPNPQFNVNSDSAQTLQYILPWINQTSKDVTVTFKVYMGDLDPYWYNNGVSIQGDVSPLNWTPGSNLMSDSDDDSLFTVNITFPKGSPFDVEYKYTRKDNDNNWWWENVQQRPFVIDDTDSTQILEFDYWDDNMPIPENIAISVIGQDVSISWDEVYGATDYDVLRSSEPYSGFTHLDYTGGATNYTDSGAGSKFKADKYFYQIKAVR